MRTALTVLAPTLRESIVVRRPMLIALAGRLDLDRRAVRQLQRLRARYGPGPLKLAVPGRSVALLLSAEDTRRALTTTPDPFAPATRKKPATLAHFEPHGLLISRARQRPQRRRFTAAVLEADRPMPEQAPAQVSAIRQEARSIGVIASATGFLTWHEFEPAWWRAVRRITLGDASRDDHELTHALAELRKSANWSFLRPVRPVVHKRFLRRLRIAVERAGPSVLAGRITGAPGLADAGPVDQLAHWLLAFDAAGVTAFRTLALLAAHPAQTARAHREIDPLDLSAPQLLPYLRACVLDTVRLWPTTPLLLRNTTVETCWDEGTSLPSGTSLAAFVPLLHRDSSTLPWADSFAPEIWTGELWNGNGAENQAGDGTPGNGASAGAGDTAADGTATVGTASPYECWALVPFSAGPGACPGRNPVLLAVSTLLAALLEKHRFQLRPPLLLDPDRPLPGTVNPFALHFAVAERCTAER